jgi:hypothetical protein
MVVGSGFQDHPDCTVSRSVLIEYVQHSAAQSESATAWVDVHLADLHHGCLLEVGPVSAAGDGVAAGRVGHNEQSARRLVFVWFVEVGWVVETYNLAALVGVCAQKTHGVRVIKATRVKRGIGCIAKR